MWKFALLAGFLHLFWVSAKVSAKVTNGEFVKWVETKLHGKVHSKLDIRESAIGGRGIFAKHNIPANTVVLEVYPFDWENDIRVEQNHAVSSNTGSGESEVCSFDKDTFDLASNILALNFTAKLRTKYKIWFDSLPPTINLFNWTVAEKAGLFFLEKVEKLNVREGTLRKYFAKIYGDLDDGHRTEVLLSEFQVAMSVVLTRAFDVPGMVSGTTRRVIFPYLSFFNHDSNDHNTQYEIKNGNQMVVQTTAPIAADTELLINYGPGLSSEDFLLQYDFVPNAEGDKEVVRIPLNLRRLRYMKELRIKRPLKRKRKLLKQKKLTQLRIMKNGFGDNDSVTLCRILAADKTNIEMLEKLSKEEGRETSYSKTLEVKALKIGVRIAKHRIKLLSQHVPSTTSKYPFCRSRLCKIGRLHARELSILQNFVRHTETTLRVHF